MSQSLSEGETLDDTSSASPGADRLRGAELIHETTAVIISTRGRPDIVKSLVDQLRTQTTPPTHIFVIGSHVDDIAQLDRTGNDLTVAIGREGSTRQRNDGLRLAGSGFANLAFFDDDFVPSRFWLERMAQVFRSRPDVAGVTGTILEDGTRGVGIKLDDAKSLVLREDARLANRGEVQDTFPYGGNVGCNMAFRMSAVQDIEFDERMPLYAWHEDSDFRGQVEQRGFVARVPNLWGVHLGHKKGRGSGLTLGYSQIANPVYLARKGTVPSSFLANIAMKNVMANAVRSVRPEPFVDRRGRLRGNLVALADLLRGRLSPERILEL